MPWKRAHNIFDAKDDDRKWMKREKAISYVRLTQCGFLCNERPQCNFLPRNSKNPIFSSETNFSSGSFPLAVRQVCALANRFQITRWIWIFIIYLSFDNPLNANLGKSTVFDFDLSWYPSHWEMGDYE